MNNNQIREALDAIESVLADAYHRHFAECCGRGNENGCCGDFIEQWTPEDHKILDTLSPIQRSLQRALAAEPAEHVHKTPESIHVEGDMYKPAEGAEVYAQENPFGGPAKVFDAMAAAIRAGDSYHDVLKQFGYAEAKPADEAQAVAKDPYCYIYEFDSLMGCHRSLSSAPRNGSNPSRSVAVYTHPTPEAVRKLPRLTEEELDKIYMRFVGYQGLSPRLFEDLAGCIMQAMIEKHGDSND